MDFEDDGDWGEEPISYNEVEKSRRELLKQAHKRNLLLEEYITLVLNRDYEDKN
tara:strand:- start:372 stop:533 length:162 start_codon:yes stop_codon:yes gene_type:complete